MTNIRTEPLPWMINDGTGKSTLKSDERGWIRENADGNEIVLCCCKDVVFNNDHTPFVCTLHIDSSHAGTTARIFDFTDYEYTVDFGDGNIETFAPHTPINHIYAEGTYIVSLSGTGSSLRSFPSTFTDLNELMVEINQFGTIPFSYASAFEYFDALTTVSATDDPCAGGGTSLEGMFMYTNLTSIDVSSWDTKNITNMNDLFIYAPVDVDVSGFDVSSLLTATNMMDDSDFSIVNYDKLLLSWSQQAVQPNVTLGIGGNKQYTQQVAKSVLTSAPNNWTIIDGGLVS